MIIGNVIGATVKMPETIILVDEHGNEYPAVMTDEEVELTATVNDLRLGKTAILPSGVEEGTKEIPLYNTREGYVKIQSGRNLQIKFFSDRCQYTKFQAIICEFNTSSSDSVSAQMVSINDKVYAVNSTSELSDVTVDPDVQSVELNVVNNSDTPVIIRYFTYKEEY